MISVETEPDETQWAEAAERHETAVALADCGRLEEAELVARDALASFEAVLPPHHPDTANALDTLAGIVSARGRSAEALELWSRSLAAFEEFRSEPIVQRMRVPVLHNFGYALIHAGEPRLARATIEEAIAEARRLDGDGPEVGAGYAVLGVLCKLAGRLEEAAAAYAEAERMLRDDDGALPPELVHNLAGLACARGDFARAAELLEASVAARRAAPGGDQLGLGTDLSGLGDALAGQGRAREAIALYREALDVLRAGGLGEHPEVAFCLHNLGDALTDAADPCEAERCYREALARKEACFGQAHHEVAATAANLSTALVAQGRGEEARALVRRAWSIARALDADHPVRIGCELLSETLEGDVPAP